MRRLRTIAARLALLATVSSSLSAAPCGPTGQAEDLPSDAADHAGHSGRGAHDRMDHHGGDIGGPGDGDTGVDCGALMSCGVGLRGMVVAAVQTGVPSRLDGAPIAAVAAPSSADRTQDPPPPRRDT